MTGVLAALAMLAARFWPRGSGCHVRLPGPEAPAADDTMPLPRIGDGEIPPSMMTMLDLTPVRPRPYYDPEAGQ